MSKKIACFVGQIVQEYQNGLTDAARETAWALGYDIYFFSEFGSFGDNVLHAEGEKNIINLPFYADYDAIIVGLDTFDNVGMDTQLVEKIQREAKCPVVAVRQKDERFYNVVIDDRAAVSGVIEHFINVHGKKRICYMAGRMNLQDARDRLKSYTETMEKYELPVEDNMVFYGDYWQNKGDEAVEWFYNGEEPPEVIACANDYMALAVYKALRRRGISVPEDVALSGFDDVDEARFADMRIASVRVPAEDMGNAAVKLADRLIKGIKTDKFYYVPVKEAFQGSCGCCEENRGKRLTKLQSMKEYLRTAMLQTTCLSVELDSCNSIEELLKVAFMSAAQFEYDNIYFCVNEQPEGFQESDMVVTDYADNMILWAVLSYGDGLRMCSEKFPRREILPAQYREKFHSQFIFPLHYKDNCIGYIVLQTQKPGKLGELFPAWVLSVSSHLDRLRRNRDLAEYKLQSVTDELTGLYNKRAMNRCIRKRLSENRSFNTGFAIVSIDMDGLKYINDTYGHLEGDVAICAMADILKTEERDGVFCARVGGDEFMMCIVLDTDGRVEGILSNIEKLISDYNRSSGKKYPLAASIGWAKYERGEDIKACMQRADDNMFADKKRRHVYRTRGAL